MTSARIMAQAAAEKLKNKVLVQTGPKTWVYLNPGESPTVPGAIKSKLHSKTELRGGHNRRMVSVNGTIYPSLRVAAKATGISSSRAERLVNGKLFSDTIKMIYLT